MRRQVIGREGLCFVTEGIKVAHLRPEIRVERESRQLFSQIMGLLHLEWTCDTDGRNNWDDDE